MKEEEKNQPENVEEKAGQTVDETATEDLTAEQIAGKTPEELAELYGNVKKMQSSATQKYQEVADLKRQVDTLTAEKSYAEEKLEKSLINQKDFYEKVQTRYQEVPPGKQSETQPPSFADDPEAAYNYLLNDISKTKTESKKNMDELVGKFDDFTEKQSVATTTQQIDTFLEKTLPEIAPDVTKGDVVAWFNDNPGVTPGLKSGTIMRAIQERQIIENDKKAKWEKKYLSDKEAAANQAQEKPGAGLGSLPPGKTAADMSEAELEKVALDVLTQIGGE